jgi:hypothetical protein
MDYFSLLEAETREELIDPQFNGESSSQIMIIAVFIA